MKSSEHLTYLTEWHKRPVKRRIDWTWVWIWTLVLAVVGAIVWMLIAADDWEDRCHAARGHVVEEYVGDIDIDSGDVTISVPNYAYHCMNDQGEEIL